MTGLQHPHTAQDGSVHVGKPWKAMSASHRAPHRRDPFTGTFSSQYMGFHRAATAGLRAAGTPEPPHSPHSCQASPAPPHPSHSSPWSQQRLKPSLFPDNPAMPLWHPQALRAPHSSPSPQSSLLLRAARPPEPLEPCRALRGAGLAEHLEPPPSPLTPPAPPARTAPASPGRSPRQKLLERRCSARMRTRGPAPTRRGAAAPPGAARAGRETRLGERRGSAGDPRGTRPVPQ